MATKNIRRVSAITICICLNLLLCACGAGTPDTSNTGITQVVNPLVEVATPQDMEAKLGYSVPVLKKDVSAYIVLVIDGVAESGRIRYTDGSDFNIKQGSGDISGIYGGTPAGESTVSGVSVSYFTCEELRYAIWEKDGFTFSLTGGDTLEADVAALLAAE